MELEFLADHKTMGGSKFPLPDNDRQQANMEAKCLKMHQAGWIHGDLHGENIMVGANDDIRIIDMGFAKKLNFDAPGITPAEVDSFTVYLFDDFERLRASDDSKIMPRYQALEADINAARNKYMNNRGQYPDEIRKKAVDEMRLAYNRFRSQ